MRAVIYVGGSGRHLVNQSATVVADRIARAMQRSYAAGQTPYYRVRLEADARVLAPDISIDIVSIQLATRTGWEPFIDVFEVKYLNHLTRSFAPLSHLGRAARAVWVLSRFLFEKRRSDDQANGVGRSAISPEDQNQLRWLDFVRLLSIGSIAYWLIVGVAAVLGFSIVLGDLPQWLAIPAVLLLVLAEAVRKPLIEPFAQWAMEGFAATEYQIDNRRFLAVPNSILDAIAYASARAHERNYEAVDLLTFSLGSLLAADAIFPKQGTPENREPDLKIDNWITIGFPFDSTRHYFPDYFDKRMRPRIQYTNWMNVVVKDDFLGTEFAKGVHRGIGVGKDRKTYAPNVVLDALTLPGHLPSDEKGDYWRPLRRLINHCIYWNDEDARAPSCFDLIIVRANWISGKQKQDDAKEPEARS